MNKLVDLSHFNGVPDLVVAHQQGHIDGVIIKATEGLTYQDSLAGAIAMRAQQAGIPFGYYHFGRPGQGDPEGQAKFFLDRVAQLPAPQIRLALDHEVSDGLPAHDVANFGQRFEATLQAAVDYVPLLYTYPMFASDGNCAGLGSYLLWFARYGVPQFPTAPSPWTSKVALWQSGQETVPGIAPGDGSGVDVDWTNDLAALLITAPPAPVTPAPPSSVHPKETSMFIAYAQGRPTVLVKEQGFIALPDNTLPDGFRTAGLPVLRVSPETFDKLVAQ